MPSRSEVHKLFYLVCLDGAYDEIPISKYPTTNELYVDATMGPHHNYWGPDTTALMVAAHHGRMFAIGYLLNWGANASLKNHEGKTALTIAMMSPGNLGAYEKIGRHGRDNICELLARNTRLDTTEAYDALYYASQQNLDRTCQTLLSCHPLLEQKLKKLFKSQKQKTKDLTELKLCILRNPPERISKMLNSDTKPSFSRRLLKFG